MTDLYTRLCSSVLFPIHERLKRHRSVALLRELERTQWWEQSKIEALQVERLRDFLAAASTSVPYYGKVFAAAGFDPARVDSISDLRRLPFLTKAIVRDSTEDLKSNSAGPLVRYSTGGSSGEPLVFYMGLGRINHDVAAKWRATRWWGVDIGDVEIVLWGSPIEIGRQDRLRAIRDRLFRSHLLPAFQMSAAQLDHYLDEIRRLRPKMLFGYASALALLASHARTRQRRMDGLGVQVTFTTGETLYPQQREVLEDVFGAPVANGYGSRDAGFIAHQCPKGSMHISSEHIVVELIDGGGQPVAPGESGEVVVTHLGTGDFPFIRYRTGDIAVMGTSACACGRGLPVFERVFGRSTDFIRTSDGNVMHALALIYEIREKPGVQAFKFIQAEDLSLELQLVASPELTLDEEAAIRRGLERRMGPRSQVTVRRVAEILPESSGKYRYVVSRAVGP